MTGPVEEGSVVAHVKADISDLETNVARAQAKLEELTGKKTDVTVGAKTATAQAQLKSLQDAIDKVATAETRLQAAERASQNAAAQSYIANLRLEQEMSKRGRTELSVATATEASARADRNAEAAELKRAAATDILTAAQVRLKAISDAVLVSDEKPKAPSNGGGSRTAAPVPPAGAAVLAGVAVAGVVGGMSTLAAISNAVVAGLLMVANAFGAVMVAGGLLMVAYSGLNAQLTNVAQQQTLAAIPTNQLTQAQKTQLEQLNATISGYGAYVGTISNLKTALTGLRDNITSALFTAANPGIAAVMNTLLPQVQGALLGYATVVGQSLSSVLSSLSSAGGVDGLNRLLQGAQHLLPPITQAAESLGSALGHIFIDALPATQGFVNGLSAVVDKFNQFITANPDKVKQFFADGVNILGAFGGALSSVGKTMSNLVTPEVVKQTVDFLHNMRDSAPFFQTLFQFAAKLQIFNLIGQIFDKVGNALTPLLNVLSPLMSIVYTLVSAGLSELAIVLQAVGLLLTPVGWGLQLLADAFKKLQPYADVMTTAMSSMFTIFQHGADTIATAVKPALDQLFSSMFGGLPTPQRLAEVFQTQVLPALQSFTSTVVQGVIPVIKLMVQAVSDFIQSMGGFEGIQQKLHEAGVFFRVFGEVVTASLNPVQTALSGISSLIDQISGKSVNVPRHSTSSSSAAGLAIGGTVGGFADGGSWGTVLGGGSTTSDSILTRLSTQEEVTKASSASFPGVRPLLKAINKDPRDVMNALNSPSGVSHHYTYPTEIYVQADPVQAFADFQRKQNLQAQ